VLTTQRAREAFADWEMDARAYLARFRADAARHADDPAFAGLVTRMREASPEARAWWVRLEVEHVVLQAGIARSRGWPCGVLG
jgi:hypothetical protein